jgi:chromosome segregation ATPase
MQAANEGLREAHQAERHQDAQQLANIQQAKTELEEAKRGLEREVEEATGRLGQAEKEYHTQVELAQTLEATLGELQREKQQTDSTAGELEARAAAAEKSQGDLKYELEALQMQAQALQAQVGLAQQEQDAASQREDEALLKLKVSSEQGVVR